MRTVGLEAGRRIGARFAAIQPVFVVRAGARIRRKARKIARVFGLERNGLAAIEYHLDGLSYRRPDSKVDSARR